MILEYKIEEQDFLEFQLFTASKSERIKKKKRNGWLLLSLVSVIFTIHFYINQNIPLTIYCGVVTIATGLFYPKYFKWRYKNHYKAYIKDNYSNRFGLTEFLEIKDNLIYSKNKIGEGKINISEIEKIDETENYFFIKISNGFSLIIPKIKIEDLEGLRLEFKNLGLIINNELNWKW